MKDEGYASGEDLIARTRRFALNIIRLYGELPRCVEAQVLGKQLLRSGTSVGAHYREARRAKSSADFVSKIEGALQVLDETAYWLELLAETGMTDTSQLLTETEEIIAIMVTIAKKVKQVRS